MKQAQNNRRDEDQAQIIHHGFTPNLPTSDSAKLAAATPWATTCECPQPTSPRPPDDSPRPSKQLDTHTLEQLQFTSDTDVELENLVAKIARDPLCHSKSGADSPALNPPEPEPD